MRLGYFGLPLGALLLAADGHTLELAVLSPVEAPGRRRLGRLLGPRRVLDAARLPGDAVLLQAAELLERAAPELIVSWFWTRRIPARLLALAGGGGVGVHPSLLPRHRGPDPFYWAIDSGDELSGVTVHRLTEEYDAGAMLAQRSLRIGDRNAWQLARALDRPSLEALRDVVGRLGRGEAIPEQQQEPALVTAAPVPSGAALRLRYDWTVERALRRVRALCPVPGLALSVRGLDLFATHLRAADAHPAGLRPGEAAVRAGPDPRLMLQLSDGCLAVERAILAADDTELTGAELAARLGSESTSLHPLGRSDIDSEPTGGT